MSRFVRSVAAVVWGLVALAACGPAEASPLSDAEAREHLEEMERRGVLRDPVWAHAYWARSRQAPTSEARISDLEWALRFDPELNAARWELVGVLLRSGEPGASAQLVAAVAVGVRSFPGQQRLAVWLFVLAFGGTLATCWVLSMIGIARTVPRIAHGVRERLQFLPPELRSGATLLTLLVPFALALTLSPTAAVLWTLLLGTAGAWRLLGRGERRACVTAIALLLLSPVALSGWTVLTGPAHPYSYLNGLWAAQTSDVDAKVVASAPQEATQDPDYHASLALLARRDGKYAEAVGHLRRAIQLAPDEWSYQNNLGNVLLLQDRSGDALNAYARARQLAPREPLILVNESQAWVDQLEFNRASNALEEANRLGYRLPPVLNAGTEDVIVRDQLLGTTAHWTRFARGQGAVETLDVGRLLGMSFGLLFPMAPFWMSIPLWFAIWYVTLAHRLPRAFHCDACQAPICRKCHYRVQRRSLCSGCYAIRRDVKAPLKRQEMFDERRDRATRFKRLLSDVVAFTLPGTGGALRGSGQRGAVVLGLAILLILMLGAGSLWPDPGDLGQPGPPLGVAIPLVAFYLLLAGLSLRSHRRALLRTNVTPPAEPRPEPTQGGA